MKGHKKFIKKTQNKSKIGKYRKNGKMLKLEGHKTGAQKGHKKFIKKRQNNGRIGKYEIFRKILIF